MSDNLPEAKELARINLDMPPSGWMDTPATLKKGMYCHGVQGKNIKALGMPNPRDWLVEDDDWQLPDDWHHIVMEGLRERLHRFRSLQIFMDICVRCGA